MTFYDIIVIGAGPAGCQAAVSASHQMRHVRSSTPDGSVRERDAPSGPRVSRSRTRRSLAASRGLSFGSISTPGSDRGPSSTSRSRESSERPGSTTGAVSRLQADTDGFDLETSTQPHPPPRTAGPSTEAAPADCSTRCARSGPGPGSRSRAAATTAAIVSLRRSLRGVAVVMERGLQSCRRIPVTSQPPLVGCTNTRTGAASASGRRGSSEAMM